MPAFLIGASFIYKDIYAMKQSKFAIQTQGKFLTLKTFLVSVYFLSHFDNCDEIP